MDDGLQFPRSKEKDRGKARTIEKRQSSAGHSLSLVTDMTHVVCTGLRVRVLSKAKSDLTEKHLRNEFA